MGEAENVIFRSILDLQIYLAEASGELILQLVDSKSKMHLTRKVVSLVNKCFV